MVRVIIGVLIFASVFGAAVFVEAPAAPNITTCDQALMGYAYAAWQLMDCQANPLWHCGEQIAAEAAAANNVAIFCGIEEMPF